jgi:hypothetical protein
MVVVVYVYVCSHDWTPIPSIVTSRPPAAAELHPRPNHRGRRGCPLPFHETEQEVHDLAGVLQGVGGVRLLGALGHEDPDALAPLPQHLESILVGAVVADVHREDVAAVGESWRGRDQRETAET